MKQPKPDVTNHVLLKGTLHIKVSRKSNATVFLQETQVKIPPNTKQVKI